MHVSETDVDLPDGRRLHVYDTGGWLAGHRPSAEVWLRPDDGHIAVLDAGPDAMRWLRQQMP